MGTCRRALLVAALLVIAAAGMRGQSAAPLNPADAKSFLGVWDIEMTEPAVFKGTHTIRIWDNNGSVAASLQTNPNFPAIDATGIHRDGTESDHQARRREAAELNEMNARWKNVPG